MRLTDHTDYALRVLMYLNKTKSLITLNELETTLRISKNNLIKISNQLAKLGFIESEKGRFGGVKIGPSTGQLSLKEIIVGTERTFQMATCFQERPCDCTFLKNCQLRKSLAQALDAFLNSLADKTLDDVTIGL